MKGFLNDLYLRPSCYACPTKNFKSGSDITIGDFWGIQHVMPMIDDDKGVSVVMVNTESCVNVFNGINLEICAADYDSVLRYNPSIERSVRLSEKRNYFYVNQKKSLSDKIEKLCTLSYKQRLKSLIIRILTKLRLCK